MFHTAILPLRTSLRALLSSDDDAHVAAKRRRANRVGRLLALFEADDIEDAVEVLIAELDARSGDPDLEDDERAAIVMRSLGADVDFEEDPIVPDGLPGDPIDAEDDDPDSGIEDDSNGFDPEEDFGIEDCAELDEGERGWIPRYPLDQARGPIPYIDRLDPATISHRDYIRRARCDRLSRPNLLTGATYQLRAPSASAREAKP
jgi:hypothetical protein